MVRLEQLTVIRAPIERCFDLARSVEVHLEGNTHWGESAVAAAGVTSGLVGPRQCVTWRANHFGFWFTLTSEITGFDQPAWFQDTMVRGPFRSMQHDHWFRALPAEETEMREAFSFVAPVPMIGRLVELVFLARYMRTLLLERNTVLKAVAESSRWKKYLL